MSVLKERVEEVWQELHAIPEIGFEETRTSAYLAEKLSKAGYQVRTGIGGTGVTGLLDSGKPGHVVALRADMDALGHEVNGEKCAIHSCGHDAHCAIVLTVAEEMARKKLKSGKLKIIFQPAEELLTGALRAIEDGAVEDVDILLGLHLRPVQEAKKGQATPALYHGASYIMQAEVKGLAAHGARPHLGVNAIDAAAAIIQAVNAIHVDPVVPATVKTTKIQGGGPASNAIPEKASLTFDLRTQKNTSMQEVIEKTKRAVECGAASVGATASATVLGGCPAAEYDKELTELLARSIVNVLGEEGLLPPTITPGGEDFHFYVEKKPSLRAAYFGLGVDLTPGLHHPEMCFDQTALVNGVDILLDALENLIK